MSEFEKDYDKGIDRFLGRFWEKKQKGDVLERIRQEHRRDPAAVSFFEELSEGEAFRQTADLPVKYRCQVLVVGGGPAGLSAALGG
jgi:NADPH-dependent 2,4-dienoyl-CoA reductase/sulfur reductase-like enzyme